jgi:hypothetical protein
MVLSILKTGDAQNRLFSNGFSFRKPLLSEQICTIIDDRQACVGLLALSSFLRISKLQNLNGDERFDSRRLHHLFYYQSLTSMTKSKP